MNYNVFVLISHQLCFILSEDLEVISALVETLEGSGNMHTTRSPKVRYK